MVKVKHIGVSWSREGEERLGSILFFAKAYPNFVSRFRTAAAQIAPQISQRASIYHIQYHRPILAKMNKKYNRKEAQTIQAGCGMQTHQAIKANNIEI